MKYDRPVWQIMHRCADAMPAVFRYEDVRDWFAQNYPDVNEATIRAHLIGLTEGGRAKHVQFAQRSPVFRRVARGEYEAIPVAERGEDPNVPVSASKLKMSGNGAYLERTRTPQRVPEPELDDESDDEPTRKVYAHDVWSRSDDTTKPSQPVSDIILLGSVGERVNVPAPAKEVYRDVAFQLSRLDAELSGSEWFVLSAEHGLMAPNEWMSPDSRTLADMDPDYRVVWASWVVARLQSLVGSLDGAHVRLDAPDAIVGPLFAGLQDMGALVSSGGVGASVGPRTAATVQPSAEPASQVSAGVREVESSPDEELTEPDADPEPRPELAAEPTAPQAPEATPVTVTDRPEELAPVVQIGQGTSIGRHLADPQNAVPASDVSSLPDAPGLYGWFADASGARELNRSLKLPVPAGLVFVGQVGGSSWHGLADPVLNLRDHVERVQLRGPTRASTFRMTLATVLRGRLRMTSLEDPVLTRWMLEHLSVSSWASDDFGGLRSLAETVIGELDPPLNVDHLAATEYRARLGQMRSGTA